MYADFFVKLNIPEHHTCEIWGNISIPCAIDQNRIGVYVYTLTIEIWLRNDQVSMKNITPSATAQQLLLFYFI